MNDYYKNCAVPKPPEKKKKKLMNGWKDKPRRRCVICGQLGAERHELFGGPNRQISIREGFQVDLCRSHHEAFHRRDPEWLPIILEYQRKAQRHYEMAYIHAGMSPSDARHIWMELIGRNYLTEEEDYDN